MVYDNKERHHLFLILELLSTIIFIVYMITVINTGFVPRLSNICSLLSSFMCVRCGPSRDLAVIVAVSIHLPAIGT